MQRNVAGQRWAVFAFEDEGGTNPGEPVTGDAANITANLRIDGGAANAVDDTNPTELEDGYYVFDITAAESNGDHIVIAPASATANVNVIGVPGALYTTPANFPDMDIDADGGLPWNADWDAEVQSEAADAITAAALASQASVDTIDSNVDAILVDTGTTIPNQITGLNDLSAADVNAQVDTALADIHLDHLLAVDYDPASPPGVSTALLNEIIESDGGVARFTANALEQGPSGGGGGATVAQIQAGLGIHETTIATLASQTSFTLTAGSADNDAYNGFGCYIIDSSTSTQIALGQVSDYVGSTRTVTLTADPGIFTMATGDTVLMLPADLDSDGSNLTSIPWNSSWDAEVQSEVQDAIEANHLDHLLAADYDPASPPGVATAYLNEIAESDGGVTRFTVNALENGPSGSGASAAAIADAVWDEAQADHTTAGSFGEVATEVASILADTNELQTDDVPGLIAALNDVSAAAIRAEIDSNSTQLAAIVADTNELQTDDVPGLIAALNDISTADVNAQVLDVLNTDSFAEPTGAPSAADTLAAKIGYLYMALRNRVDVTASTKTYYDDGGNPEWSKSLTDNGTTYSEAEGA